MGKLKARQGEWIHSYLSVMQYFATGEGFTYEVNFCYADNPQGAIEKHLDRFVGKDKNARDYFRSGIEVYVANGVAAKKVCRRVFKESADMLEHLNQAGREMYFKLHYNYN